MNRRDPEPGLAPCRTLETVCARDVTYQAFRQKYFNLRTPVLLKNACADWPFMQKWTSDYLSTEMGDFQCKIARDSRPYHSNEQCSLSNYFKDYSHLSTLTFELCDPTNEQFSRFLKDILLPNPFFCKKEISGYSFFHAHKDEGTLPHCHIDAFNFLQYGTKHWIMYDADPGISPIGRKVLKQCREEYGKGTFVKDWFTDGPSQVRQAGVTIYEGKQQAGDMVFIPENFSHAVLNIAENQGIVMMVDRPGKTYQKD